MALRQRPDCRAATGVIVAGMKSKPTLTIEDTRAIAAAAEAEALKNGWAVTLAVVDDVLARLDKDIRPQLPPGITATPQPRP